MRIIVTKNPKTKKWDALIDMDGYAGSASADRVGCALRDLINRFEYTMGKPAGDLQIDIEGW